MFWWLSGICIRQVMATWEQSYSFYQAKCLDTPGRCQMSNMKIWNTHFQIYFTIKNYLSSQQCKFATFVQHLVQHQTMTMTFLFSSSLNKRHTNALGQCLAPNSNLKRFYGLGMRLNNFFFFLSAVSKYITLENCPSMFDLVTFHRWIYWLLKQVRAWSGRKVKWLHL